MTKLFETCNVKFLRRKKVNHSRLHIVDSSILHALNCLSTRVNEDCLSTRVNDDTNLTIEALNCVLIDNCYDNQNALNLYRTRDMMLCINNNTASLVEPKARRRAGTFFYLGNNDGTEN